MPGPAMAETTAQGRLIGIAEGVFAPVGLQSEIPPGWLRGQKVNEQAQEQLTREPKIFADRPHAGASRWASGRAPPDINLANHAQHFAGKHEQFDRVIK